MLRLDLVCKPLRAIPRTKSDRMQLWAPVLPSPSTFQTGTPPLPPPPPPHGGAPFGKLLVLSIKQLHRFCNVLCCLHISWCHQIGYVERKNK